MNTPITPSLRLDPDDLTICRAADGSHVFTLSEWLGSSPTGAATAAAIVERFNGYAAAIEALRAMTPILAALTEGSVNCLHLGAIDMARAVLTQCDGKPAPAPLLLIPGSYRVRATKEHRVSVGKGEIAIAKGVIRTVNVDAQGRFSTFTDGFSFFGVCQIGNGWEVA